MTLLPVGYIQLTDALKHGYWHARLTEFYQKDSVFWLLWGRLPWDLIFTAGVVILLVITVRAVMHLKKVKNNEYQNKI
nr:hypothetical protein [Staphylococcus simulans]